MKTPVSIFAMLTLTLGGSIYSPVTQAAKPLITIPSVISVYAESVAQHPISQSITLIGKLKSDQFVSIAAEVSGKIKNIKVQTNDKVKQGDLLFQLEDSHAQAALLEARAFYNDELRKLNEYARLVKSNAVTQTSADAQAALVDIAQARLAGAQAQLDYHTLNAPFSGTVGFIDFSRGKMVSVGEELLTLDDLSNMQLDLQVPERYLSQLAKGMQVTAKSEAWPDITFNGELIAIDSRVNTDTLNLRVRLQFNNRENKLKPGMMLVTELTFPKINKLMIPVQALEYSGTKRFVYVINANNQAQRTEVILGARIKNDVLIESGLTGADTIVVQGLVNLSDGATVKVLTSNSQTPADKQTTNSAENH